MELAVLKNQDSIRWEDWATNRTEYPCGKYNEGCGDLLTILHYDLKRTWSFNEKSYILTPTDSTIISGGKIIITCTVFNPPSIKIGTTHASDQGYELYQIDSVSTCGPFRRYSCKGGVDVIVSKWEVSVFYPLSKNWRKESNFRLIYP